MLSRMMWIWISPLLAGLLAVACAVYPTGDEDGGLDPGPVIGRPCLYNLDCGEGYACFDAAPGGYCLFEEPNDCASDEECPEGTVCAPRTLSQRMGQCLMACQDHGDCRPDYTCNHVELFPGEPDSQASSEKVCWLPCHPGQDYLCNEEPVISSLRGTCEDDFTCTCAKEAEKVAATGRCL